MRSRDGETLRHLADNIAYLRGLTPPLTLDALRSDLTRFYATTRALEIISEASRRLSPSLIARWPDVPWARIRAAGNVYRHEYPDILEEFVLAAATTELDGLEQAVLEELKRESQL